MSESLRPAFEWRGAIASPFGPKNPTTRHVLLTLALHMSVAGDNCFPTLDMLAAETGLSKRAVQDNVALAQSDGWLGKSEQPAKNGKGWRRIEYFALVPEGVEECVKAWRQLRRKHGVAAGATPKPVNNPVDNLGTKSDGVAPDAHGMASDDNTNNRMLTKTLEAAAAPPVDKSRKSKPRDQWWVSDDSIVRKAKALGIDTLGKSALDLKNRIHEKLGHH